MIGGLSPRQSEVLLAYVRNGTQRSAARALGLSEQTVKNHLGEAYARLEVTNIVEAIYVLWLRQHFGDDHH